MFPIPIALMVFNRPELAQGLLDSVRSIRPDRLFIVADAARPDREGESEKVNRTRQVFDQIDWPCEVTKIYADENLGCGLRIRSGISQAFSIVDRLIVLEDDCRPNDSFFRYTQSMLSRYEHDERIMAVSGTCLHDQVPADQSYFFSRYAHCWGWGTWRRAWQLYNHSVCDWPSIAESQRYLRLFDSEREKAYWTQLLDNISLGKMDTWDVQWMLACWLHNGLSVIPTKNLVRNVGFGEDATHTKGDSPLANLPTHNLDAIVHPEVVVRDAAADAEADRLLFSGQWKRPRAFQATLDRLRRSLHGRKHIAPGNRRNRSAARAA